jgi:hypothetical protein
VQEVYSMPFRRGDGDTDTKVKSARLQVDLAVLKMAEVLDRVQEQANKAKEELNERRAS